MNTQTPPHPMSEPLPEPVAFMYPSDLANFAVREMTAHAVSVSCTNVDTRERTSPLYTVDQMRARDAMWAERLAEVSNMRDIYATENQRLRAALAIQEPQA